MIKAKQKKTLPKPKKGPPQISQILNVKVTQIQHFHNKNTTNTQQKINKTRPLKGVVKNRENSKLKNFRKNAKKKISGTTKKPHARSQKRQYTRIQEKPNTPHPTPKKRQYKHIHAMPKTPRPAEMSD